MTDVLPIPPELLDALVDRLVERLAAELGKPRPLLVRQEDAPDALGVSRSAFFRLKGVAGFPREVRVEGAGVHFRRADLERWAAGLKARRTRRPQADG